MKVITSIESDRIETLIAGFGVHNKVIRGAEAKLQKFDN
jgi:hypothetical protein